MTTISSLCPRCFKEKEDMRRLRRCPHTFCLDCIKQIFPDDGRLRCPICSTVSLICDIEEDLFPPESPINAMPFIKVTSELASESSEIRQSGLDTIVSDISKIKSKQNDSAIDNLSSSRRTVPCSTTLSKDMPKPLQQTELSRNFAKQPHVVPPTEIFTQPLLQGMTPSLIQTQSMNPVSPSVIVLSRSMQHETPSVMMPTQSVQQLTYSAQSMLRPSVGDQMHAVARLNDFSHSAAQFVNPTLMIPTQSIQQAAPFVEGSMLTKSTPNASNPTQNLTHLTQHGGASTTFIANGSIQEALPVAMTFSQSVPPMPTSIDFSNSLIVGSHTNAPFVSTSFLPNATQHSQDTSAREANPQTVNVPPRPVLPGTQTRIRNLSSAVQSFQLNPIFSIQHEISVNPSLLSSSVIPSVNEIRFKAV